ncbi:MAG TPA: helicase-associated domain-containing protein [Thermomicrobiales bacterium]|nr:helicase-associated domain-containing protein [Thermomicrobiales bacterium]
MSGGWTGLAQDREQLRAAFDSYAAADVAAMLEALSPGAGATRRKAERIEHLMQLLTDSAFARRAVGALSPLGRRLLGALRRTGRTSIATLLLAGQGPGVNEVAVRGEVEALIKQGLLIVEGRETAGKVVLELSEPAAVLRWVWAPQAVLAALAGVNEELPPLQAESVEPPLVEVGSFAHLRRDLYLALRFLKATGLRLTRAGEPHRADLRKLHAALQPGQTLTRRDAGGAQLEGRLLFLLKLLDAAGLTEARDNELVAVDGADAFLAESDYAAAHRLFDAWLTLDWNEFRRLAHLVVEPWSYAGDGDVPPPERIAVARQAICAVLNVVPRGWVWVEEIAERLRQTDPEFLIPRVPEYPPNYYNYYNSYYGGYYGNRQVAEQMYYRGFARAELRSRDRRLRKDQDWNEVEGAFVAQVLGESLRWLGLIDAGYDRPDAQPDSDLPALVRLTELGVQLFQRTAPRAEPAPASALLVVQPNFEVLVLDALANLTLVARLDAFADTRSLDRAAVYHLSRASIVRGLEAGWTEDEIVTTLETASAAPLPQNVRQTLRDWAQEYERIHVYPDASLLEAPDAETLARWLAAPAFVDAVVRRLTPSAALIQGAAADRVGAWIEGQGTEVWSINYAQDPPQVLDLRGPDQVIVAREDDDPYLDYRLSRFADRQESGTPGLPPYSVLYTIAPATLARAKAAGLTVDQILSFLGYKARTGLSPDDTLTLRGWSGYYAPFRWAQVRAIELPPTANWGDLSRVKAIRPLILRILSASLALVSEEHWPRLEAALTLRGITLQPGFGSQPADDKRGAAQRAAASVGLATGREIAQAREASASRSGTGRGVALQHLSGRALCDFVEAALDNEQPLIIEYRKPSDRRSTRRVVEPRELEVRGGSYYLHAFCRTRQEDRVFRLNNIVGVAQAED